MSTRGTDAYQDIDNLPGLVQKAVRAARRHGFPSSCRPEQGRLLQLLAAGAPDRIGETGTGCGVGLAWLASGASGDTSLVSVERDPDRARIAAEVFEGCDNVEVVHGDWSRIEDYGPFDLLVLDGGGQGKTKTGTGTGTGTGNETGGADDADRAHCDTADPARLLAPGGVVVIDDFTPVTAWPPRLGGEIDLPRVHWLEHPALHATELRLAPDLSAIVGTYLPAA